MMTLYGYWRSSASYRLRIALALKGLDYRSVAVDLRSGAQKDPAHLARNPQGLVPVLELEDGTQLTQSLAIMDYLEEVYPRPALLPADPLLRAKIRAAAHSIAMDIHPIQNLRVLSYLKAELSQDQTAIDTWCRHWIERGFESLEKEANRPASPIFMTDAPGYFACVLIPQIYNARRFNVDMRRYPRLLEIEARCLALPEFAKASPEAQPDSPQEGPQEGQK